MKAYIKRVIRDRFGDYLILVTENGDVIENVMVLDLEEDNSSLGLEENRVRFVSTIRQEDVRLNS